MAMGRAPIRPAIDRRVRCRKGTSMNNIRNNAWQVPDAMGKRTFLVIPVEAEHDLSFSLDVLKEALNVWKARAEAQHIDGEVFLVYLSGYGTVTTPYPFRSEYEAFCNQHGMRAIQDQCNVRIDV